MPPDHQRPSGDQSTAENRPPPTVGAFTSSAVLAVSGHGAAPTRMLSLMIPSVNKRRRPSGDIAGENTDPLGKSVSCVRLLPSSRIDHAWDPPLLLDENVSAWLSAVNRGHQSRATSSVS